MNARLWQFFLLMWLAIAGGVGCNKARPAATEPRIVGSPSDPPVSFQVAWHPGHQYDVSFQLEQSTQVRNRNTDEDFGRDVSLRLDFAGEVPETNAIPSSTKGLPLLLELTGLLFDLIRNSVPLIHYDTRNKLGMLEDDQRTTDALEKLVGSKWKYIVSPDGKVRSAEIEANTPTQKVLDPESRLLGISLVRRFFNPHFFRPFLEVNTLPSGPVKIGDSWPIETAFNAGTVGTVVFKGSGTFRGWQLHLGRKCARIDLSGDLLPPGSIGTKIMRAMSGASMLDKGTLRGRIWFDPEQQMPLQSITDLNMLTVSTKKQPRSKEVGQTNNVPPVKWVVPLDQKIVMKINDLGPAIRAAGATPKTDPASAPSK